MTFSFDESILIREEGNEKGSEFDGVKVQLISFTRCISLYTLGRTTKMGWAREERQSAERNELKENKKKVGDRNKPENYDVILESSLDESSINCSLVNMNQVAKTRALFIVFGRMHVN